MSEGILVDWWFGRSWIGRLRYRQTYGFLQTARLGGSMGLDFLAKGEGLKVTGLRSAITLFYLIIIWVNGNSLLVLVLFLFKILILKNKD